MEAIIYDPSKIDLKIEKDAVDICYTPIIQSGGVYDIKVSAVSNADALAPDVIICSLGARYKNYCANISRTFMVDPCKKMEVTYAVLLGLHDACLQKCVSGGTYKSVYEEAIAFITKQDVSLLPYLPKSFGFAIGLEFRDGTMVLNSTNNSIFQPGTVLNLSVGFHNVPLSAQDTEKSPDSIKKLTQFSLLLADTIVVQAQGPADILTKMNTDLTYNLADVSLHLYVLCGK